VLAALCLSEGLPRNLAVDPRFLSRGSFGEWNRTLQTALTESSDPVLDDWRRILLSPRDDFEKLLDLLGPLWEMLIYRIEPEELHTLSAWRVLGRLRNDFVGHGTFGNQMKRAEYVDFSAIGAVEPTFITANIPMALFKGQDSARRTQPEFL